MTIICMILGILAVPEIIPSVSEETKLAESITEEEAPTTLK